MRLNKQGLVRMLADAILINLSLLLTLALRLLVLIWMGSNNIEIEWIKIGPYAEMFRESFTLYLDFALLLTVICLLIFYFSGFYTFGRAYQSRYKALVILQAVTLSYLSLAFALHFFYPGQFLPRTVSALGWLVTVLALAGSRLTAAILKRADILGSQARAGAQKNDSERKSVLVVGGAGYIGSVLIRRLLKRGYNVRVLDILMYGDAGISDLYGQPGFEFVKGDFRRVDAVVSCMKDMDFVVHLGAIVGDPACAIDEDFSIEVNLAATKMIAEVGKGYGVQRFVFASTCSVYGASDEILSEKSTLNPVSLYAETKIGCEDVLLSLEDSRFSPIILRLATVYGMSPRPRFDLVVNLLTAKAVYEKEIAIYGGSQWRPFVHVEDVAEAIVKCLETPLASVKGEIFNVGSNKQNYQIRQVGDIVKELNPEITLIVEGTDSDHRNYHVSFDKINRRLNFTPQKTVQDGILEIKAAIERGEIGDYRYVRYDNRRSLAQVLIEEDGAKVAKSVSVLPLSAMRPVRVS